MDAHELQLKIFLTPDSAKAVPPEAFVPVFHRWIKERLLPELVIDVANYLHVPDGPGVVLIGDGSDYFMDQREGRLGLLHSRKRASAAPADRLRDLARRTLDVAARLEREPALSGSVHFSPNELVFRVNDRLAAPTTDATFAAVQPELERMATQIFGGPFELTRSGGLKDLFTVRMTSPASAPLATLLERAGGSLAPDGSRKL
jgi:hypothetical protein